MAESWLYIFLVGTLCSIVSSVVTRLLCGKNAGEIVFEPGEEDDRETLRFVFSMELDDLRGQRFVKFRVRKNNR